MIQSKNHKNYYTIRDRYGLQKVRTGMVWGKDRMIQFLENLADDWGVDPYWQYEIADNWADIPLSDISQEGGGPRRSKVHRFGGHVSHRCGIDVDIYVIRKDGDASKRTYYGHKTYDLERTKILAEKILIHGASDLEKIFITGDDVIDFMKNESKKLGLAGVIHPDKHHADHFHVRLKNKQKDPMCVA